MRYQYEQEQQAREYLESINVVRSSYGADMFSAVAFAKFFVGLEAKVREQFEVIEGPEGSGVFSNTYFYKDDLMYVLDLSNRTDERTEKSIEIRDTFGRTLFHSLDDIFVNMNHSFRPNVEVLSYGRIYATRQIKPGDEIVSNYLQHESEINGPFRDRVTGLHVKK